MKCIYDLTAQCHKGCPEVECYNYDKVNEGVTDNEQPLEMIKFEEKDKCHWEDGCRADFFKELTSPYKVQNMQEFIAKIRAEAIEEYKLSLLEEFDLYEHKHGYPCMADIKEILWDTAEQLKKAD